MTKQEKRRELQAVLYAYEPGQTVTDGGVLSSGVLSADSLPARCQHAWRKTIWRVREQARRDAALERRVEAAWQRVKAARRAA